MDEISTGISRRGFVLGASRRALPPWSAAASSHARHSKKNAADNPVAGEETKSTLGSNQHQAKTIGIDEMTVTMEIVDGKIKSVDIDANESPECGQGFIPMLAQQIKDKQSGDIDVIGGALVCLDRLRDAVRLVVHDDGKQVVAVGEVVAFRLVDEDAGFSHCFPG